MKASEDDPVKEDVFVAGPEFGRDSPPSKSEDDLTMVDSASTNKQEGVKRIEAVAMSWSSTSLIVAYIG